MWAHVRVRDRAKQFSHFTCSVMWCIIFTHTNLCKPTQFFFVTNTPDNPNDNKFSISSKVFCDSGLQSGGFPRIQEKSCFLLCCFLEDIYSSVESHINGINPLEKIENIKVKVLPSKGMQNMTRIYLLSCHGKGLWSSCFFCFLHVLKTADFFIGISVSVIWLHTDTLLENIFSLPAYRLKDVVPNYKSKPFL